MSNGNSQVHNVESAIEYIIESCDPSSNSEAEALRQGLHDKLDYRVGHFLGLDDGELLSLSNAELGSLVRDLLNAMDDVACEGFTSHEVATVNKMLMEFMTYYNGCKKDGRLALLKEWANQR